MGAKSTDKPVGPLSPTTPEGSKQDSGCEIEDTVIVGGARPNAKREVRTVGVGPEEQRRSLHVGVWVREQDLGLLPEAEALRSQVGQLEGQLKSTLEELQSAQQQVDGAKRESRAKGPQAEHPVMATSMGWQEPHDRSLQMLVSFTQQPQARDQRTVGIQVYTLEQPTVVEVGTLLKAESCSPPCLQPVNIVHEAHHRGPAEEAASEGRYRYSQRLILVCLLLFLHLICAEPAVLSVISGLPDTPVELPIAVSSKQVRDVLRSEVSTSVPVANPAIAMGTSGNQLGSLHLRDGERKQHVAAEAVPSQGFPKPGNPSTSSSELKLSK